MHETTLAGNLYRIASDAAKQGSLCSVSKITAEAGEFNYINEEQLRFAFGLITRGDPVFAACGIEVLHSGAAARCSSCDITFPVHIGAWECPRCGKISGEIVSGFDFNIKSIEGA